MSKLQENSNIQTMNHKTSFKQLKPKFDEDEIGVSPFRTGFKITVFQNNSTSKSIDLEDLKVGEDTVTIGTTTTNEKVFLLESEHKTQVYTNSDSRKFIAALSLKAKSLYLWLIYDIEYSKEYVWINVVRYMKENNVSANTYRDSMKELVKKGIIYPIFELSNMFWVNPRLFFKGNRIKTFKEHLKIR